MSTKQRVVMVWDEQAGEARELPVAEVAANMVAYARSLGPGTAACGEIERQAIALLHGDDCGYMVREIES